MMPFPLPQELEDLIQGGHWPTEARHVRMQNCNPLIPRDLVRAVFPDESLFCFCLPPFRSLADIPAEEEWRRTCARPDLLSHSTALVIGDFELGSDSVIVLDYGADPIESPVKWLRYEGSAHCYWDTACATFRELADRLRLRDLSF